MRSGGGGGGGALRGMNMPACVTAVTREKSLRRHRTGSHFHRIVHLAAGFECRLRLVQENLVFCIYLVCYCNLQNCSCASRLITNRRTANGPRGRPVNHGVMAAIFAQRMAEFRGDILQPAGGSSQANHVCLKKPIFARSLPPGANFFRKCECICHRQYRSRFYLEMYELCSNAKT